jgi:hypothetical protein
VSKPGSKSTAINQTIGAIPVTGTATIQEFVNQGDALAALVDVVGTPPSPESRFQST